VRRAAAASDEEEEDDDEGGGGGSDDSDASFDVPGSDSDGDDPVVAFASQQARKAANVKAMLSGKLTVERAPLLPKLLSLTDAQAALRKPFKPPVPGSTATGPSGACESS
jgi:DNA repair and recombination RAD54-like protein